MHNSITIITALHNHLERQQKEITMSTDYAIGLLLILLASILWSTTAMIVQYLFTRYGFNSPFLVTYTGCALFMMFLTPSSIMNEKLLLSEEMKEVDSSDEGDEILCRSTMTSRKKDDLSNSDDTSTFFNDDLLSQTSSSADTPMNDEYERIEEVNALNETSELITTNHLSGRSGGTFYTIKLSSFRDNDVESKEENDVKNKEEVGTRINKAIFEKYIPAAFKLLILWFISNYYYNFSLTLTSLTSSTILSNMSCVFTFLFALMFGEEVFSKRKLIGVISAFMGCILTSLHDIDGELSSHAKQENNSVVYLIGQNRMLWGDFYGFLSALGTAAYSIAVRKVTPLDGNMNLSLVLGFVGLIHTVLFAPYVIYLLTVGRNTLFVPTETDSSFHHELIGKTTWIVLFGWLFIKGLFGSAIASYSFCRAIVLTSATVAAVGLNIMIPVAMLSDTFIMHKQVLSVESGFGALLVIIGFVLVN